MEPHQKLGHVFFYLQNAFLTNVAMLRLSCQKQMAPKTVAKYNNFQKNKCHPHPEPVRFYLGWLGAGSH
jgi:hypothetical protein